MHHLVSYVLTAFTMERATNTLGRFPTTARRPPLLPFLPGYKSSPDTLGFSLPQGRWFVMILASFIHACFFLTSAASTTFPGVLAGFAMNGFAKGNMICERLRLNRCTVHSHLPQLLCRLLPQYLLYDTKYT